MNSKKKLFENFGEYLYQRLPKVYRDYDVKIERVLDGNPKTFYTLQEYLYSFAEGGFQPLLEDLEAILSLLDPMKCPEEFLPLLLHHFGLDFVEDIPVKFQRRLVQNIVTLYKKKGTIPALSFLARELSGFDVHIEETSRGGIEFALVKLDAYENEDAELLLAQDVVQRYIYLFLPTNVSAEVIVTYGYTEGIHINSTASYPADYDHVKYDVVESMDEYIDIDEGLMSESFRFLNDKVDEDFNLIKADMGELGLENHKFTPFDASSLTNLIEDEFVYTNGIVCEDKFILAETTGMNGELELPDQPDDTTYSVKKLMGDNIVDVKPVAKLTSGFLREGTTLELKVSGSIVGYFTLRQSMYCTAKNPALVVYDKHRNTIKLYYSHKRLVFDGTCPLTAVSGYYSYEFDTFNPPTVSTEGGGVYLTSDSKFDSYIEQNSEAVFDSSKGRYPSSSDDGKLYMTFTVTDYVYFSKNGISTVDEMKRYLRENPVIAYAPYTNSNTNISGLIREYAIEKQPLGTTKLTLNFSVSTQGVLQTATTTFGYSHTLVFTDKYGSESKVELPITLRSIGDFSDYIRRTSDGDYEIVRHTKDILLDWGSGSTKAISLKKSGMTSAYAKKLFAYSIFPAIVDSVPSGGGTNYYDNRYIKVSVSGTTITLTSGNRALPNRAYFDYAVDHISAGGDYKPYLYMVLDGEYTGDPIVEKITDKDLINKLNLLPIPKDCVIINSKGVPFAELTIEANNTIYY